MEELWYPSVYFRLPWEGLILPTIHPLVNVNHKINEQPVCERVLSSIYMKAMIAGPHAHRKILKATFFKNYISVLHTAMLQSTVCVNPSCKYTQIIQKIIEHRHSHTIISSKMEA